MNRPSSSSDATSHAESLLSGDFGGKHFSSRQLRVLRKEMLSLRAAIERAEISEAAAEVRGTLSRFGWIKWLMPGWAGARGAPGSIGVLMRQYPLISSLASMILSGPLRHTALRVARPAAKLGMIGLTGWMLWKGWRTVQGTAADAAAPDNTPRAG